MKTNVMILMVGMVVAGALLGVPVMAQETTGTVGSPDATTTIDGKQLPPPDAKFGGVIKDDALQSTPWWAPRVVPSADAPNVLLIITDDAGFAVPSTFGGVIPTPAWTVLRIPGCVTTGCSPPPCAPRPGPP
jgi:arylsulfatase